MNFGINPVGFVVRYNPPTIALIYTPSNNPRKKRRYEIFLNGLITLPNPEDIARQLVLEHSHFLHPEIISVDQIQRLVEKILSNIEIVYEEDDGEEGAGMDGVEEGNNDLNKSFEIDNNNQMEEENNNDKGLENFKGKGRIGFLKNLRRK